MSELTPCNFCNLAAIRERAEAEGKVVTILPGSGVPKLLPNGFDVFVHPKKIGIPVDAKVREVLVEHYWVAWMWEIPGCCVC